MRSKAGTLTGMRICQDSEVRAFFKEDTHRRHRFWLSFSFCIAALNDFAPCLWWGAFSDSKVYGICTAKLGQKIFLKNFYDAKTLATTAFVGG